MGDILKKITELLENGGNYEERRSTGIIIESNWFDAVDDIPNDRRTTTGSTYKSFNGVEYTKERKFTPKPNITDIP